MLAQQRIRIVFMCCVVLVQCSDNTESCEGNDCPPDYQGESAVDGGPSGLGAVCQEANGCQQYEADYCIIVPGLGGYCSEKDCSITNDECPGDYVCCDYTVEEYPNACLSAAKWEEYSASLCANAK